MKKKKQEERETGKLDKGSLTILTFIWSIYISVDMIFQSLLFLSRFP